MDVSTFFPEIHDGGESVAKESALQLSMQDFVERYDKDCQPVVLTDVPHFEKGSFNCVCGL